MEKINSTLYASAARTATPTAESISLVAYNGPSHLHGIRIIHVVIDVTAITLTPSVVPTIDYYDDTSGKWYNVLTGAAITATGTTVLRIGESMPASANLIATDAVSDNVRVTMTHGDTDSITYSVGINLFR